VAGHYVDADDEQDAIGKKTVEGALTGAVAGILFGPRNSRTTSDATATVASRNAAAMIHSTSGAMRKRPETRTASMMASLAGVRLAESEGITLDQFSRQCQ